MDLPSFGVSEIEWLRPSRGSVLIAINPRFAIRASVRLTGPLSKPMTNKCAMR